MRSRVLAIIVAVVVPLAALGIVISRGGSSTHKPSRLPIAAGSGSGERAALGAATADAALYPYGVIVYKAGGNLPALDGSARAYKVTGAVNADQVRRLADALGLTGEVTEDGTGMLGVHDGDAFVSAYPFGGGTWSYSRESSGSASSSGVAVACTDTADCPAPETTVPQHPAALPTEDEAKTIALSLLQRAGIDTEHAKVTVDDFVNQWSVRVDPLVDGVPAEGFGANVTIGEHGVVEYAGGPLGQAEPVDEYPLIGTPAAIDNLNKGEGFIGIRPMYGGSYAVAQDTAVATAEAPVAGSASGGASPGDPGKTDPGAPTEPAPPIPCTDAGAPTTLACVPEPPVTGTIPPPPPPQEITLTDAARVLIYAVGYDGKDGWLVPGYRFSTDEDAGPTVLAIDGSFLAPPPDQVVDDKPRDGTVTIEPQPAPLPPEPAIASDPAVREPSTGR